MKVVGRLYKMDYRNNLLEWLLWIDREQLRNPNSNYKNRTS